jgi:hypothetical protein
MSARFVNAIVEVAGLKLRGTVNNIDTGRIKRTPVMNGDRTVDHHEEYMPSMLDMDLSYVTDVELSSIEAIVEEPMLITSSGGRKIRVPKATFQEAGAISKEGSVNVKFFGPAPSGV